MPRLVDGDNLLGWWPGRRRDAAGRQQLARELRRFAGRSGRRLVVIFDGPEPAERPIHPDVRHAGRQSADEAILGFLKAADDVRGWTVVTNDRVLANRCRHVGARVERCDTFRRRLAAGPSGEKPEAEDDVEGWLQTFGADGNDGTT